MTGVAGRNPDFYRVSTCQPPSHDVLDGSNGDQILFDRLAYIDHLKRGGLDDNQARAHAEAMDDALRESVATTAQLQAETTRLEHKIESEVTRLEHKIESEAARLERKIESESARLETTIHLAVRDMTIRMGAMAVALFAALASIKFFG